MKKKLFALLLAVTLLLGVLPTAALAADSAAPDATPAAAVTAAPEVTEAPAATGEPEATATPAETGEPETTATPAATEEPETTAAPSATKEPETTATPAATGEPVDEEPEAEEDSDSPLRAPAAEQKVRVIVQNNTYPVSEGAPWDGVLVNTWVAIDENSTMMSCVVAALDSKGYSQTGAESNYISEINGLGEFDGGQYSGWMGTLNDFFTNEGFAAFTVANGKLLSGDEICISYTRAYGNDLGGSWENTDTRLKTLTFSVGTLSPEFNSDTFEYTLTVPADTESVVVTPTAANKNYQVRTYKNTATPEEDGTEYKRAAAIPVEDGAKLIVMCGHDSWPTMNGTSDGVKTYTVTVKMETEQPVSNTVRVTFSAQKDGEYLVKPAAFTVQDGTAELYGFTVPAADHADVAIHEPVFLDLLVAAHAAKYGEKFTKDTAGSYLEVSSSGWISKAFGEAATNSSFLINGQMPADENKTGYMGNEARLTDGGSAEYFFYQSEYYMDYYTAFTETEKSVYTGDEFTLTLKGYMAANGMSGSYVEPQPIDGTNENTAVAFCLLNEDGSLGDALDATLNAKGEVTFKFDKAGTYTITANGFVYDETMEDSCPIVAPSCTVTVTDPTVTVNVTISNAGAIATDKDGGLIAHRPLTVVGKSITVGDVLTAAHKAWHPNGAAAYVTEETQYGASITTFWGEKTSAVGYYVNDVMSMGLTDPVSEGDNVTAYIYTDKENYSDAHAYFNAAAAEAKTGEGVSLTLKKDTFGADYSVIPVPVANAVITVDGEDTANITNSKGVVTLVFNAAGTYVVSARTQDGSIVSPPVCVVTVTGDTQGDGGISGSGDPYARLTGLLVHTSFNPNSSNVLLRNAKDTSYANDMAVVFDPAVTEYALAAVSDSNTQLRFRPTVASGAKVTLAYGDGETKDITWTSGSSKFANCLAPGKNTLTLTVSASGKESAVYTLSINVIPTLTGLTAEGDGVAYSFDKTFAATKNDYTLTLPDSVKTLKLTATPKNSAYAVTCNGAESGEIDISDAALTEITVAVSVDGLQNEYVLKLSRIKAGSIAFNITPEECADAVITVKDATGQVIAPEEDGSYAGLFDTYTYTYTVSKYGYVPVAGTVPAEGGVIDVTLTKNAENQFDDVPSDWNNFRNSDTNMGLTDAKTPTDAESSALLWSKKLGSGWMAAPSVQIIVDDGLIVMSGTKLYKLDLATGEIIGEGTMVGSPSYGYTPPTYAAGLIFCPLGGGTVQAFNAKTLESVWVYKDPLGGQSLTPIAYSDGYIYTGFWNSEVKAASFVAVSVSDDDPTSTNEAKIASWSVTRMGGYYWAGAVIVGDTLIVGGDDGTGGFEGDSSISSFNKRTGALISSLTLTGMGDQRSSIAYDAATGRVYFTTKNGYLCSAALDAATGVLSDLKSAGSSKQSTTTPIVYKGRAYYALGAGFTDPGDFVVADAGTMQEIGRVSLKGYPQCSPLLSTAYEDQGWLYFYSTYNTMPGGITLIKVKTDAASAADMEVVEIYDAKGYEQYCISSLICDKNGTLYYKNDSGNVLAFGTPTYGSVIRQIRAIGEVTEDSYLAIEAARNAYNALTPEDQAKVTNEPDLTAAENAYAKLIEEKIDAIGTVTLEKEEPIKKTAELFDQMNETMQGKVSNADKLALALKTLSELKVAKAEELIEQIPTSVTNANKKETQEKLKEAKKYLESLTEDEQAKVTNKNRIDLAEAAIKKLTASGSTKGLKLLGGKKQSESVNAIVEAIRALLNPADPADKLPEDMADRTEAQEDAILDIARAYNELSDDNKLFVTNYGDFEPVLEKLGAAYHADKETGVSVDGLPWHIRLVCVPLEEGSELLEAMNPVFSGKGSAESMYWVTLIDVLTGKTYKTEEPFTVRLPLDKTPGENETALAMYVSEDGKLRFLQGKDEEETAEEAEKTLAFETTETSCWYGAASINGTWDDLMNGKILMEAGDELTNWLHWLAVTVKLVRTIVK